MKANYIYQQAEQKGIYFESTCADISQRKWDKLMNGATRADKKRIDNLLVRQGHLTKENVKYFNPYDYYKTNTHLIYVHSAIEHFYKINT